MLNRRDTPVVTTLISDEELAQLKSRHHLTVLSRTINSVIFAVISGSDIEISILKRVQLFYWLELEFTLGLKKSVTY